MQNISAKFNVTQILDKFIIKQPRLRTFLSKIIFGSRDTNRELLGRLIFMNTEKENGYFRASISSRYSSLFRDELAVMLKIPIFFESDMDFLDVGANIGLYSIMMSDFSRILNGFTIHAFEPNPDTFTRLSENAKRYGFEAYNFGISNKNGSMRFVQGAVSHVTTTIENFNSYNLKGTEFDMQCKKLSEFNFLRKVAIKIDVEGQEYEVLEGAEELFKNEQVIFVYLDGYHLDTRVETFLKKYHFGFMNGRNLLSSEGQEFSLLAVHRGKLEELALHNRQVCVNP